MVRRYALRFITRARVEIGVASTKAFPPRSSRSCSWLTLASGKLRGALTKRKRPSTCHAPPAGRRRPLALELDNHPGLGRSTRPWKTPCLGRGVRWWRSKARSNSKKSHPRQRRTAGELKHGPLLVTSSMPGHQLAQRRAAGKAQEQHAGSARPRSHQVHVCWLDADTHIESAEGLSHVIRMPTTARVSPLLHVCHRSYITTTACARGRCGQARNLAKRTVNNPARPLPNRRQRVPEGLRLAVDLVSDIRPGECFYQQQLTRSRR